MGCRPFFDPAGRYGSAAAVGQPGENKQTKDSLGTPVVLICPFYFGGSLLTLNSRKKGTPIYCQWVTGEPSSSWKPKGNQSNEGLRLRKVDVSSQHSL